MVATPGHQGRPSPGSTPPGISPCIHPFQDLPDGVVGLVVRLGYKTLVGTRFDALAELAPVQRTLDPVDVADSLSPPPQLRTSLVAILISVLGERVPRSVTPHLTTLLEAEGGWSGTAGDLERARHIVDGAVRATDPRLLLADRRTGTAEERCSRGTRYMPGGLQQVVEREPSVPVSDVIAQLPGYLQETARQACKTLFRKGSIHPQTARYIELAAARVLRREACVRRDEVAALDADNGSSDDSVRPKVGSCLADFGTVPFRDAPRLLVEVFALGLRLDAIAMSRRCEEVCSKSSLASTVVDGEIEVTTVSALMCKSHRCRSCATMLGVQRRDRVRAQLERDQACARAPCLMVTLSVDRDRYCDSVYAMRDLGRRTERFFDLVGKEFGEPRVRVDRRGRRRVSHYLELARHTSVEWHDDGYPHIHELWWCPVILAAMISEAAEWVKKTTLPRSRGTIAKCWGPVNCPEDLADLVAMLSSKSVAKDVGRKRCPFPETRRRLNELAVDAGLGKTGFYVAPVVSIEQATHYLCKENVSYAPFVAVSSELTKTRQLASPIPRGFKRFRATGSAGDGYPSTFFIDEEQVIDTPTTKDVVVYSEPVAVMREHFASRGFVISNEVLRADLSLPPQAGQKRPRVLHAFDASQRLYAPMVPPETARAQSPALHNWEQFFGSERPP